MLPSSTPPRLSYDNLIFANQRSLLVLPSDNRDPLPNDPHLPILLLKVDLTLLTHHSLLLGGALLLETLDRAIDALGQDNESQKHQDDADDGHVRLATDVVMRGDVDVTGKVDEPLFLVAGFLVVMAVMRFR